MRYFTLVLAWCSVVFSAVATADSPVADTSHPGRIVLLVDEIKQIRSFPVVLAERLGYLKDEGAVVTVMNIRDDATPIDMLEDGRVDAVMAYYHHAIVGQSEGKNIETIILLGATPGAKVMIANQSKGKFKTLADLKGSRIIAGGAGSSKTTLANYLMLAGGNRISDYTRLTPEGKDKIVAALRNGEADFVIAPTPDGDYYESQGVAAVFADLTGVETTKKYFRDIFPSASIYMVADHAKAHPEVAQHLANAFARTLKFINTHTPEEIAAVIPIEISGKDHDAYLKTLKEEIPMFATDGIMPASAADKELRALAEFNPKYKTVKLDQTYTNDFANEALKKFH